MKRSGVVMMMGVVAAFVAFACVYFTRTASSRELLRNPQPELAWLKNEFSLSEDEFQRITKLHQAYLPKCAERCRLIAEQNAKLEKLLADANEVTPEIEAVIAQRAKMRSDCETEMLKHFIAVSRSMPPEQGRRYLVWVQTQSSLNSEGMEQRHEAQPSSHHHHP